MITLESMVEEVGPFGRFQILLISLNAVTVSWSIMSMMFMIFGAVEPDWWCVPRDQQNQSYLSFWNETNEASPPFAVDGDNSSISSNTTGLFSVEPATKACEAMTSDNGTCEKIVFSPGMSTVVTEFQLVCDLSWVPSLTISLQMVGVLIGSILSGQLADSVGRKKTMVLFIALLGAFNLIAAFSVSWQMFAALRALIGSTIGGLLVISFPYPTEFLGAKWRAIALTIPVWGLASLLFSLLVWALPHWGYLHVIIGAASLACLPAWIFLPESVHWLIVKGHMTEAHQVLCKMARWNGRKPPSLSSVEALCSDTDHTQKKYNYFHIFSTCKMMKISCLAGLMWVFAAMTYFGISFGIKNLSGDFHLNFFLMVLLETPSPLMVYHLSGWLGRRWAAFTGFLLVSLALLAVVPITLFLSEAEAGSYVNGLCIVARFCIGVGWNSMALFHAELYPTVVRNIGMGYLNMIARVGGILGPYLQSVKEPYVFYALLGGVMALTAIAPLLLPETRGQPLQDELEDRREERDAGKDRNHEAELCAVNA